MTKNNETSVEYNEDTALSITAEAVDVKSNAAKKNSKRSRSPIDLVIIPLSGNIRRQVLFWIASLIFLIVFLVTFSDVLLPFVVGLVLAYFLNPIVEFLEKIGFSRMWATVMIVLFAVFFIIIAFIILAPVLASQLTGFIKNIPGYVTKLQTIIETHHMTWLTQYKGFNLADWQGTIESIVSQAAGILNSLLPSIWSSGKALMNMITLIVVAPVVAFYMLLDWDRMVASVDSWIPREHLTTVRSIFHQMDRSVAGFIRGQGTVCLMLGIYYAIILTITGLNFGLLVGLFMGFITFIPYAGSAIGFILAMGLSIAQYWPQNWPSIIVVACVFFVGQFLEGYVLQPKLVGSSVGLHPVWLMFALFAFGSLFGFTGMLIAVPAAAAVGVLVRFALHTYLASPLYKGHDSSRTGK